MSIVKGPCTAPRLLTMASKMAWCSAGIWDLSVILGRRAIVVPPFGLEESTIHQPADRVGTPPHRRRGISVHHRAAAGPPPTESAPLSSNHHPADKVGTPPHRRRGISVHHPVAAGTTPPTKSAPLLIGGGEYIYSV